MGWEVSEGCRERLIADAGKLFVVAGVVNRFLSVLSPSF
jgi:hypothetical protein